MLGRPAHTERRRSTAAGGTGTVAGLVGNGEGWGRPGGRCGAHGRPAHARAETPARHVLACLQRPQREPSTLRPQDSGASESECHTSTNAQMLPQSVNGCDAALDARFHRSLTGQAPLRTRLALRLRRGRCTVPEQTSPAGFRALTVSPCPGLPPGGGAGTVRTKPARTRKGPYIRP